MAFSKVSSQFGVGVTSAIPAWFANITPGNWGSVAAAGTAPVSANISGGTSYSANGSYAAWNGLSFDYVRNRAWKCKQGGHGDYYGNESYMLDLMVANPAWVRVTEPTPTGSMNPFSDSFPPTAFGIGQAVFADGYPRTDHGTFNTYADDRVWSIYHTNVTGPGNGNHACDAFNTQHPALLAAIAAGTPLARDGSHTPFEYYPPSDGNIVEQSFGVSAFDRARHRIWGFAGKGSSGAWYCNTSGANIGVPSTPTAPGFGFYAAGVCACPDLDIIVTMSGDHTGDLSTHGRIAVLNCATGQYAQIAGQSNAPAQISAGYPGLAYIAAQKTILMFTANNRTQLHRLRIPMTGNAYNPSGTWVWDTPLTPGGVSISAAPSTTTLPGSHFQLIENMGNGESALFLHWAYNQPTYVYRLPVGGV